MNLKGVEGEGEREAREVNKTVLVGNTELIKKLREFFKTDKKIVRKSIFFPVHWDIIKIKKENRTY